MESSLSLAVINCKKAKQEKVCTAEEMYWPSMMFRAMVSFIKVYYKQYVILSAEHGVLYPTDVVKPYNKTLTSTGYAGAGMSMSDREKEMWVKKVLSHPVWKQHFCIDFHVSKAYWKLLQPYFPNAQVILLPSNTGLTTRHYEWLLRDFEEGREADFTIKDRPGMPAHPDKKWYHPVHGTFYGNEWSLYQKYGAQQNLDLPTLDMVDSGRWNQTTHHKGWCLRKEIFKRLYFDKSRKMWRVYK